ncbi:HNHc domain containing protein [uncultured Caudovirales phage]|uniref:HNHc domain containing protein n=1 Tax=uncultured Caudovirales phage TaxID=2100421 RepID=A0A6J5TB59_9CAUD|nr:HNHc domain containing protein [uncultured Caudovirales phage]
MNPRSRLNRYCMRHGGRDENRFDQKHNRARPEFNAMYSSAFWIAHRQAHLSAHPLCAGCEAEGRSVPARVVDHVFAWSHIGQHAFRKNLFQSLCDAHHAEKGRLERQGIYRRWGATTRDYSASDYGKFMCKLKLYENV